MRSVAVPLLTVAVFSVLAGSPASARQGCNGLLAFSSNRAEDALPQLYSISLDGKRTDLIPNLGSDVTVRPSPDGSKLAYPGVGLVLVDANGSNARRLSIPGGSLLDLPVGAWAPDSTRLAVDAETNGNSVVAFDASSGKATSLGSGWGPVWSPDSATVAFVADLPDGESRIFLERPDGSGRRQLAPGQRVVGWSPDGTRLLIDYGDMRVVSVAGGDPIEVPNFEGVAWTPDGSRIVGVSHGGSTLESVAADGTDPHVIASNALGGPWLSPDGRRVLFVAAGGHSVIANLDGSVVRDFGRLPQAAMTFWRPSWSPDSSKVLFWSDGKVLVADVDSGQTLALAGRPTDVTGPPLWSSDGSAVLDSISDATGNTDIYVARPDGSGQRRVFGDPVPEGAPVWSRDGKHLTFVRYGARPSLIVTDAAGHARTVLRDPGLAEPDPTGSYSVLVVTGLGPPAWSPDGRTIAAPTGDNVGILLVDALTGRTRIFGTTDDTYPAFSPDGRSIAYATPNVTGGEDVVVAPFRRRGRSWSVHAGEVYGDQDQENGLVENIRWSPDGKRLSFIRFARGEYGNFGYSTRTLDARTHRVIAKSAAVYEHAAVSPDGRFIAVAGYDTVIRRTDGTAVKTLSGVRSVDISWQSLCRRR
jgi:Tol biopolymer transport system component